MAKKKSENVAIMTLNDDGIYSFSDRKLHESQAELGHIWDTN